MNNRIEQLDSIRGLAAFAVLISHIPIVSFAFPYLLTKFLQAIGLMNGHGAVMLFFVLSGFVLSIPFFKQKEINSRIC
jgi:peptidoglycan/LPS O-acetylase OafA/YrhL